MQELEASVRATHPKRVGFICGRKAEQRVSLRRRKYVSIDICNSRDVRIGMDSVEFTLPGERGGTGGDMVSLYPVGTAVADSRNIYEYTL